MTSGPTTLYCIKTFYSASRKMMRTSQWGWPVQGWPVQGWHLPGWVLSSPSGLLHCRPPVTKSPSTAELIFPADLFLLFIAGLIRKIWKLSKLYFLYGLGWRLCVYLNKTATSFQIPPCLQAFSTHTQINKGSGSFLFFFPFLLISSTKALSC